MCDRFFPQKNHQHLTVANHEKIRSHILFFFIYPPQINYRVILLEKLIVLYLFYMQKSILYQIEQI